MRHGMFRVIASVVGIAVLRGYEMGSSRASQNQRASGVRLANSPRLHPEPDENKGLRGKTISPRMWGLAWLGLGITVFTLIALIAGLVLRLEKQSFVNLQHTSVTVISLLDVLSDLEDAEVRERGYLLTGEPSDLEPYNSSRKALEQEFERLRVLVMNNPKEREQVERLHYVVQQKLDDLRAVINMREAAGFEAARALALTGRGKQLTDAIRREITDMEQEKQSALARFSQQWQSRLRAGLAALVGSAILAGCFLLIVRTVLARSSSRRQEAEEELRASARRFEILCEQAPLGIYETDAEGQCVYTNRRWSEMSGLSASESLGRGWVKALHPDDRAAVFEGWERNARRGTTWEYRLLNAQGKTLWIRAVGGPIYSEQGTLRGYVGTLEDVTERKQAEERFRLVVEAAPSGMVMTDRDGKIVLVNSRTEKLFGYERKELLGQSIEILVPESSRENHARFRTEYFVQPPARAMETGRDLYGRRKDGTQFPMEVGLNPIETEEGTWLLSSMIDITERKQAEATLRESEERFRRMADSAPVLIWVADPDKLCTFFNKTWLEFTGRAMEQEVGNGWTEGIHPDDVDRCMLTYFEAFDARRRFRMEYRLRRGDGEYRWILDDGVPRFTSVGIFAGYIGSCVDITEKRSAEEERQKFVSLADSSLEFVGMCDLDFMPFYINAAGMGMVGLDNLEAARRVKVQDYFFPEDQPFITNKFFPRVLRTGHDEIEIRFRHFKTGEAIWMLYKVFKIFDARGVQVGWATVSMDITERKKVEAALREALQQLQLITDNMPAAVARCSRDLRYIWASRSYAAWTGLRPDELVGRRIADLVGQQGYDTLRPHIEKVLSGERDEFETRVVFLSAGARWVNAVYVPTIGENLKVGGWIAVVADVTDRHEAEERLRQSEERFRVTFFQAAVGIAQTSIDGQWRLLNERFCEILGYSREELRGRTFIDITHPDDREAALAGRRKLLAGEISSWSSEKRYIRKDGVTVWAKLSVSLVRDQHNEPQYFISVVEDITEKIRAEHALQASRQELRSLTGRLINAQEEERKKISRELHDDLSQKLALLAIDTGSLLLSPSASPDEIKEPLRNLQARIVQLSRDVRQISHQLHPAILEDLGLTAALSELCEEFSARVGIEAVFEQETMPKALPVDVASCLYRVAQEALHNVSKHAHATQVRLKVSGSREGIHLSIWDNGVGFDSDASLSKHGLGIVSMKERVRLVQGEFSIQSQPGQGTTIRIFAPFTKEYYESGVLLADDQPSGSAGSGVTLRS